MIKKFSLKAYKKPHWTEKKLFDLLTRFANTWGISLNEKYRKKRIWFTFLAFKTEVTLVSGASKYTLVYQLNLLKQKQLFSRFCFVVFSITLLLVGIIYSNSLHVS